MATKTKSKNYMGQILYSYIQQRNQEIKDFNRYHFKSNYDGTYRPVPGCDYSEPLALIDWDNMVTTCNNLPGAEAEKIRSANRKVYAAYMSAMEEEVFGLIDEVLGFELKW